MNKTEYNALIKEVAERLGYDAKETAKITLEPGKATVEGAYFKDGRPVVFKEGEASREGFALFVDELEPGDGEQG